MPGVWVGRDRELSTLLACLDDAHEGRPGLVVCVGEPGIGKTRLARELEARACARDALTVWGTPAGSGAASPLWHWREVVADLVRKGVGGADEVLRALDLGGGAPSFAARARLFDSLAQLLASAAATCPVVVLLDDFHEADEASHLLLRHLVRVFRSERLLIVVAARGLGGHLGTLLRDPCARSVELRPLGGEGIAAHFRATTGREPSREELAVLERATAGNPFLLGELVGPVAAGQPLTDVPLSVADFVERRVAGLPAGVRRCLTAGAVLGLDFASGTLSRLTGHDARSACGVAVREGLLRTAEEPGRFVFAHGIVRNAVLDRLDPADRAALHRAAALTLGQGDLEGGPVFEIAEHWRQADVPPDLAGVACEVIARAGHVALRRHAYEDARRLFAAALAVSGAAGDVRLRAQLLLARATTESLTADLPAALRTCRHVIDLAHTPESTDIAVAAALVCEPSFDARIDAQVRAICEAVLARPGLSDADQARVLSRYAVVCDYLCDPVTAEQAGDRALACADRADDAATLTVALDANRLVRSGPDSLEARARAAERMRRLGGVTHDPETRLAAAEWHFDIAAELGDLSSAARELRVIAQCASDVGGPVARWRVLRCHAMLAQARGQFADARRYGRLARDTVAPIGLPQGQLLWRGLVANLCHHTGYDADSLVLLEVADGDASERDWPLAGVVLTLYPAWVLTQLSRLGEARAIYRRLGPVDDWPETPHARLFTWALGIATAAALGASDDVVVLRDRLAAHRGHHVVNGRNAMAYLGPAELWLGVAAAHLGLVDDAVVDLEHAGKACAANGADGFRAEAETELATVLVRRSGPGDLSRARGLAAGAARTASLIGAASLQQRARAVLNTIDAHPSLRLTPREVEVARLVADRLTNREIAERLYLSQRTAQNHVQHILDKLDLRSRRDVAAWWRTAEMSTPAE